MTTPRTIQLDDIKHLDRARRRLAAKVAAAGPDECWPWTGRTNPDGYGMASVTLHDGREATIRAHRLAYLLAGNEIPDGYVLRHSCDTPLCCNPAHLAPGTQAENIDDRTTRWRLPPRYGAANPNARLSAADVETIRRSELTTTELAETYGVSYTTIRGILTGTRWSPAGTPPRPRTPRGHGNRLTQEAVDAIRANPDGLTGSELARRNGVSPSTITLIRQHKIW